MPPTGFIIIGLLSSAALTSVGAACTGDGCYDFDDPNLCLGLYGPSGTCRCGLRDQAEEAGEEAEGTRPAKENEVSWAGGLFLDKDSSAEPTLICSVTLLSPRTVITAAHCINNRIIKNGTLHVGLGIHSKKYDQTKRSQFIKVEKSIPQSCYDSNNFMCDIAVLLLSKDAKLNDHVAPVCINWAEDSTKQIENKKSALVASWDWDNTSLQIYNMKQWSNEDCLKETPAKYLKFITADKICSSKTDLHAGSGGAALVTKHSGHYYLSGVVSIGTVNGDVNGYTRAASHLGWLRATLTNLTLSRPTSQQL